MNEDKTTTIESSSSASDPLKYPKSPDVQVSGSDLTLELMKFERAIKNRITVPMLVAIVSLWAPFFTADFKNILGISGQQIQAGYLILAVILSLVILKPLLLTFSRAIPWIPFFNDTFKRWKRDNESNPETKTNDILEKCFSREKKD